MRAYRMNRSVPPLSHTLPPHLQHLYFYAYFKLYYLTPGSDHWQLERQQPPLPSFRPGRHCSEPALAQAQAFFTCYTKGRSQGKLTAQLSPKWWMWRPWAAWAPLPLVSQVLRLLQSTQGYSGGQSSKGATKPPKEKKLSSVYIRFS